MRSFITKLVVQLLVFLGACSLANNALALTVRSVGSVQQGTTMQITVQFSEPVDTATGTATANYTLTGVTVTGATLMVGLPDPAAIGVAENPTISGRAADNQVVVLTVTGLVPGTTNTIAIKAVKDRKTPASTMADTNFVFVASKYKWAESGTPALPGRVVAVSDDGFDIYSAGSAQWANYDEVVLVYQEMTGDFDFKARVEFQDFSSHWARAGIMAREVLNAGENAAIQATNASRYLDVHTDPVRNFNQTAGGATIIAGCNCWESHIRPAPGAATASANATGGAPPYPNAWVRIQRVGNDFHTFHGADGVIWDPSADRLESDFLDADGNPVPMKPTIFVGPGFSPEIGNINVAEGQGRRFLYQIRFTAIQIPVLRTLYPNPCGFTITLQDGNTTVNTNTIRVTFNGVAVPVTITKPATDSTAIAYVTPNVLAIGSTNTVSLVFSDSGGSSQTINRTFVMGAYPTIPASYATATFSGTGFNVRPYQMDAQRLPGDENSIPNAEQALANGYIDPATGQPYANMADVSGATAGIYSKSLINFTDKPIEAGNFNQTRTPAFPDEPMPGIPGSANREGGSDDFVQEILTYLELKKGCYRMGVNSDDGFKVTASAGAPNPFGLLLGSYGTGRGQSDTLFDFVVAQDGVYPFRLAYWQGGGEDNVEWFTVNLATGEKNLVNDRSNANAVKAYPTGRGRAYIKSFLPAPGFAGVNTNSPIQAVLVDDLTQVVNGSIVLVVDGNTVTPTVNKSGTTTTVTYNPATRWLLGSKHSGTFVYTESTTPPTSWTNNFDFTVRSQTPDDLPANSFWIEGEDFDFGGGQSDPSASVMPYAGGAYDGKGAVPNVDYANNDAPADGAVYRDQTMNPHVAMYSNLGNQFGSRRAGGFDVTASYSVGWIDSADWENYTRTIPTNVYKVFAAMSHGDPVGTPDRLIGRLSKVTSGVGTTTQTLQDLGTFNAPSSGGWGRNDLVIMKAPDGSDAVVKLGGKTTLRYSNSSGDYDWFILAPVSGVPPKVIASSPSPGGTIKRNSPLTFTIQDLSSAVAINTVKLIVDGVDQTSKAVITKTADGATVQYSPAAVFDPNSAHSFTLTYSDNSTPAVSVTYAGNFSVNVLGGPGLFLIEAEDFDFDKGQRMPAADVMPYTGGAYNGKSAVLDIDYHNADGLDSVMYRIVTNNVGANVNMDATADRDRGTFTVTANFKIGWIGTGDWENYTRNFPTNNYEVYAALSHGDPAGTPDRLIATLSRVTAGGGTTSQTLVDLGAFNAPSSGGWGANNFVAMKDAAGNNAVVPLGGVQTLRMSNSSGDYDFFVLVPSTGGGGGPKMSVARSGANVIISWDPPTGTLQSATSVTGPWADETGGSPKSVTITGVAKFYRVKR